MSKSAEELAATLKDIKETSVTKSEVDGMIADLKNAIKDGNKDGNHSAEDFIKHMTECSNNNCSIHMMGKEFEKRGMLKGLALAEKLHKPQVTK